MNPLLLLASLATDIKQLVQQLSDLECRLRDSRYFYTTARYPSQSEGKGVTMCGRWC